MAQQQLSRLATRFITSRSIPSSLPRSSFAPVPRLFSTTTAYRNKDDPFHKSSSATLGAPGYIHEGSASRTDNTIVVEYPSESEEFPKEPTVQGRGGPHLKRTLAQFSLEGRTGVVTGGARGLGLVMAQSLVASGADVAIVDLNSKFQ